MIETLINRSCYDGPNLLGMEAVSLKNSPRLGTPSLPDDGSRLDKPTRALAASGALPAGWKEVYTRGSTLLAMSCLKNCRVGTERLFIWHVSIVKIPP